MSALSASRPRAALLPRFQRVKIEVTGRYMRPDRREFACTVTEMSPGECWIEGDGHVGSGDHVVAYLNGLGRIEGEVGEAGATGFRLNLAMSPRKRDKLAAQLTWLANKDALALPEDRRHERLQPATRFTELRLDDGRAYRCKVVDISVSGAGIEIEVRPAIGTLATIGRMRARVVRHFGEGVGLEFLGGTDGLDKVEASLRV